MSVLDTSLKINYYFEEISSIPHGSFNEKGIAEYLINFAKTHKLDFYSDEYHNVIIYRNSTNGSKKILTLQAHVDMVCEKTRDTIFDFQNQPLNLYVEDGYLKANGTTLGADDGVGVAYMLALLDSEESVVNLECIFTSLEEVGLIGAINLDKSKIKGRSLINLDGGGEDTTLISSSGGIKVDISKKLTLVKNDLESFQINVKGLSGGHSGGEIDKEKGNSHKILVRLLKALRYFVYFTVSKVSGGGKDNAIPRETLVVINVANKDIKLFEENFNHLKGELLNEYKITDSNLEIFFEKVKNEKSYIKETDDILDILLLLPNGVYQKSTEIKGLVTASSNLAFVEINNNFFVTLSLRSMTDVKLFELKEIISTITKKYGYNLDFSAYYPGWEFQKESKLREIFLSTYKTLRGTEGKTLAVHGGCECGVFKKEFSDMDIITFGPKAYYIHTEKESLDIKSFERTFEHLQLIIRRYNEENS